MFRRIGVFLAIVVALGFALDGFAQDSQLIQRVHDRKRLMFEIQDAYLFLLSVKQGERSEFRVAGTHARSIDDKIDRFVELLDPETAEGKVPNSRAKPEIWSQPDEFAAAVTALKSEAIQLAEVAEQEDGSAFNQQFDQLTEACVACHPVRPSSEGRFRSPK